MAVWPATPRDISTSSSTHELVVVPSAPSDLSIVRPRCLFPDHENRKRPLHDLPSTAPASSPWRRRRRGAELGADQQNLIRLAVERQRLRAWHRLDRLFDDETGRAVFLLDRPRAVALGAEGFHRRGCVAGTVGTP